MCCYKFEKKKFFFSTPSDLNKIFSSLFENYSFFGIQCSFYYLGGLKNIFFYTFVYINKKY